MPDHSQFFAGHGIKLKISVAKQLRERLNGGSLEAWIISARELLDQSVAENIVEFYAIASVDLADAYGANVNNALSNSIGFIVSKAGNAAALSLLANTQIATSLLVDEEEFSGWLTSIRELSVAAPDQVIQVCKKSQSLLSSLNATGFHRWVAAGITSSGHDRDRLKRYFSLEDPASLHVIELESSDVRLASVEKKIRTLATGLWGIAPVIRAAEVKNAQYLPRRTSFDTNFIRFPTSFPGYRGKEAEVLFKAAATHIAAHMEFSGQKREVKSLQPVQIAIISILEDAKVELLAGRNYPGLLRMWRSFHVTNPNGALIAESLLARLSHALINPLYQDENSWVAKGRKMFFAAGPDWDDSDDIRRIGVFLGNDLGQMRIQFNSKTYVVQPAYRDDNNGIWDYREPPSQTDDEPDTVQGSARVEQTDDPNQSHQRQKQDTNAPTETQTRKLRAIEDNIGVPVCKLPEWDYVAANERPDWVTIMDYRPPSAPAKIISYLLSKHQNLQRRISALIMQAQVGRLVRLKRQPEGDRLDLDACIRAHIDRVAGISTNDAIYETTALLHRDLSVLVLLDISESTKDLINGTANSIFSIERTATSLLAHAMDGMGDPFAIHAFCSNGRHDLRYYRIKDFDSSYNNASKGRLAGMKPGLSTRMGAALRHAGSEIDRQLTHRRLVLVITDGEPSDIDIEDKKYLVEDARKAVHELGFRGVDVFAVGLGGSGHTYLSRIFGRRNFVQINKVESLIERLPMLYFRLVG